jgi:hypothetical protein
MRPSDAPPLAQAPVQPQAFGRRTSPARSLPPPPAQAPPALDISPEAEAFAAELRSSPRQRDTELSEWKRAHRSRMWSASGPWKYWACILGVLSLAGRVHDFGPQAATVLLALRGLGGACSVMALWRGLRKTPT